MSYLVLARKWRPKRFSELVGQEHVVRALSHALDSGRVHHAFLFTGTRGVGKTTIARIFAKSLNCEVGVGAEPCGHCAVCTAVDSGRFVDLIEIDAASNTGVDDVREVIENAQYLPTRGRYKVYLVDEVHMLSRNAFNALLKTLEEPPEHVKFLLATTDPQKLPVTVLSRCLQFNLKRLSEEQIEGQMRHILAAEGLDCDQRSLQLLAHAADGSLRDGLSLLDQAIAHGGGKLCGDDVAAMLGSVDALEVDGLLQALVAEDGAALLTASERMAAFAPDWTAVLDALALALHRVQIRQLVPAAADPHDRPAVVAAATTAAELVQLWYQMAISGRRELALAPTPRIGFEMILLRMLAFTGADPALPPGSSTAAAGGGRAAAAAAVAALGSAPARGATAAQHSVRPPPPGPLQEPAAPIQVAVPTPVAMPAAMPSASPAGGRDRIEDGEGFLATVRGLGLRGPMIALVDHLQFIADDGERLRLGLPEPLEHLRLPGLVEQLAAALAGALGGAVKLDVVADAGAGDTLRQRTLRERDQRQRDAEAAFAGDPLVQRLQREHGARIVPDSVRPLE